MLLLASLLILIAQVENLPSSPKLTCRIPGQCYGSSEVIVDVLDTYDDCLNVCESSVDCHWITYEVGSGYCVGFSDCTTVSDACSSCITSEVECPGLTCSVKGFCKGLSLQIESVESYNDCLTLCKNESRCTWFNFNKDISLCQLNENCTELDDTQTDFLTGERYCLLKPIQYNSIMVVGGDQGGTDYLADSEIVDLDVPSDCTKPADYPTATLGMVGTVANGMVLVCGGDPFPAEHYTSDCFLYDFGTGTWMSHGSMGSARAWASAVMLNESHWWITGGMNDRFDTVKSTELYDIGTKSFSPFLDLAVETENHIVLKIDDTRFFLCCGYLMFGKSYFLDLETGVWTEAPKSQYDHREGFAGLVTQTDGSKEIVVSSSRDSLAGNETEILNLDTMIWRPGPPFPTECPTYAGSSLPYGNSFLAIGGYSNEGYTERNDIWHLNPENWNWELIGTMKKERRYLTALLLGENIC